jgi:hypothetical protein
MTAMAATAHLRADTKDRDYARPASGIGPPKWTGSQNRERDRNKRSSGAEPSSAFCLVEQGYGICGARDEPAHAGQQQQLVDQLGHDEAGGGAE